MRGIGLKTARFGFRVVRAFTKSLAHTFSGTGDVFVGAYAFAACLPRQVKQIMDQPMVMVILPTGQCKDKGGVVQTSDK